MVRACCESSVPISILPSQAKRCQLQQHINMYVSRMRYCPSLCTGLDLARHKPDCEDVPTCRTSQPSYEHLQALLCFSTAFTRPRSQDVPLGLHIARRYLYVSDSLKGWYCQHMRLRACCTAMQEKSNEARPCSSQLACRSSCSRPGSSQWLLRSPAIDKLRRCLLKLVPQAQKHAMLPQRHQDNSQQGGGCSESMLIFRPLNHPSCVQDEASQKSHGEGRERKRGRERQSERGRQGERGKERERRGEKGGARSGRNGTGREREM